MDAIVEIGRLIMAGVSESAYDHTRRRLILRRSRDIRTEGDSFLMRSRCFQYILVSYFKGEERKDEDEDEDERNCRCG
jgi:hypothetical protein